MYFDRSCGRINQGLCGKKNKQHRINVSPIGICKHRAYADLLCDRRASACRDSADFCRPVGRMAPPCQAHMADVRGIFDGLWILAACGLAAILLLWKFRCQGAFKNCWKTFLSLGIILGVLAGWAVIDFDSLFIRFHQIAFTNELWLLDPRTDLMIQLMPTPFFVDYAARMAGLFTGLAAGMGCLAADIHRRYTR